MIKPSAPLLWLVVAGIFLMMAMALWAEGAGAPKPEGETIRSVHISVAPRATPGIVTPLHASVRRAPSHGEADAGQRTDPERRGPTS